MNGFEPARVIAEKEQIKIEKKKKLFLHTKEKLIPFI